VIYFYKKTIYLYANKNQPQTSKIMYGKYKREHQFEQNVKIEDVALSFIVSIISDPDLLCHQMI